jgi:hypothetical protein
MYCQQWRRTVVNVVVISTSNRNHSVTMQVDVENAMYVAISFMFIILIIVCCIACRPETICMSNFEAMMSFNSEESAVDEAVFHDTTVPVYPHGAHVTLQVYEQCIIGVPTASLVFVHVKDCN